MKDQLTEALQAIKDKGGKARQAAIKAEIAMECSERIAQAIAKGEFWRIETIAEVYGERLKAASRPALKEGGISTRIGWTVANLSFNTVRMNEGDFIYKGKPQCSTHQVSTGEHCPEEPKHDIEGELLCDKCYNTALIMKLL